jgi:hypothetical protein
MEREELEKKLNSIDENLKWWEEWSANTSFVELNSDDVSDIRWLFEVVKIFKDDLEFEGIEPVTSINESMED